MRCLLDEEEKIPEQKPKFVKCKIKVIKEILDIWPECRPQVGKVYDAEYVLGTGKARDVAVIDLAGKRILLRMGEFEVVEDEYGK